MRPRIIHQTDETVSQPAGSPASEATRLRSVDKVSAPVDSPELWIGLHIPDPGAVSLERLATSAQRFTPRVSLVAPDGLLLEVKGSLHLFAGANGLLRALAKECRKVGIEAAMALAPTPLAAMVAARVGEPYGQPCGQPSGKLSGRSSGEPFIVTNKAQLIGRLASVPLTPLRWPQDVIE